MMTATTQKIPSKPKDRLVLTVGEYAAAAGVCVHTVRNLIKRGQLKALRVGRSIRIPKREMTKLVGE